MGWWLSGRGEGRDGRRRGGGRRRRAALHGDPTYLAREERSDGVVGGAVGSNSGETVRQSLTSAEDDEAGVGGGSFLLLCVLARSLPRLRSRSSPPPE